MTSLLINQQSLLYHQKIWDLGCHHFFTLRPLAFGMFRENQDTLKANLDFIRLALKSDAPLFYMHQQHTNHIVNINDSPLYTSEFGHYVEDTDGLYTNQPNQILLSTYADCTPILVFDAKNKIQINLHCGWKGYLNQILLNAFSMLHTNPNDIHVLCGPHLLVEDFEVDQDVAILFQKKYPEVKNLSYKKGIKTHIDLNKITHYLCDLNQIPLQNRHFINISTLRDERMHSFRKDKEQFKQMALVSNLID